MIDYLGVALANALLRDKLLTCYNMISGYTSGYKETCRKCGLSDDEIKSFIDTINADAIKQIQIITEEVQNDINHTGGDDS